MRARHRGEALLFAERENDLVSLLCPATWKQCREIVASKHGPFDIGRFSGQLGLHILSLDGRVWLAIIEHRDAQPRICPMCRIYFVCHRWISSLSAKSYHLRPL
jgi:hypothetical protein